jgi:hypothetical protein
VAAQGVPVTHIVTSHYDADHSGGVQALLIADNLWRICETIGNAVAAAPYTGVRPPDVAGYACAAYAACQGAWGPNRGSANIFITAARLSAAPAATDAQAAEEGIDQAQDAQKSALYGALGTPLAITPQTRGKVARLVAPVAATAAGVNVAALVRDAAFTALRTTAPAGSKFRTDGLYATSHLIDIGNTAHMPAKYAGAVGGTFYMSGGNYYIQAPGIARQRTSAPNLGAEVMWGTPAPGGAPAANAPAAFVVSRLKYVWRAANGLCPIASGQPDNDDSIGLVVRFNNFFYWTGGDLPYQGEDIVATSLMAYGLPRPVIGGTYAVATRIALFKCGHHGSAGSTSAAFLAAATPPAALISAGNNPAFEHPDDATLNRLDADGNIRHFYLTNCNFQSNAVPISMGLNQWTAANNKSRVAGDNNPNNTAPARQRGDIRSSVTQANSLLVPGNLARVVATRYWEHDLPGAANFHTENTVF